MQAAEEILLSSSGPVEVEQQAPENVTLLHRLQQQIPSKGFRAAYGLTSHHQFHIARQRGGRTQKYYLSLAFIDPKPSAEGRIAWRWLQAAALMALLSVLCGYLAYIGYFPSGWGAGAASSVGLMTAALVSFLIGLQRSQKRMVFYSLKGRIPLAQMVPNKPDPVAYGRFLQAIHQLSEEARSQLGRFGHNMLALELEEHRRLQLAKVIDADQYEQAKVNIFSAH